MKVIGVIPARYNSTRLPGKPLADIHGKPLIQYVYQAARQARTLQSVIVATDDERIAAAVRSFGGTAAITRSDHPSGTDRVAEVVAAGDAELIVNVQGDEPLLDPAMIDECVITLQAAMARGDSVGMATLLKPASHAAFQDPSVVKAVVDLGGRALYFSRAPIPYPRQQTGGPVAFEHIGLYAYTREALLRLSQLPPSRLEQIECLEQLRALENGIGIQTAVTACQGEQVSVDTARDLEEVRRILAGYAAP